MKNRLFLMAFLLTGLSACKLSDLIGDKPDGPKEPNKPVPSCYQIVEPRDPAIKCKVGDWYAPEHGKCSSTKEKCLAK